MFLLLAYLSFPRQSYSDKHQRFVCIVLRQRQHVSRTNRVEKVGSSFQPPPNSLVQKFYLPFALTLLSSRENIPASSDHSAKPGRYRERDREKTMTFALALHYYVNLGFVNVSFIFFPVYFRLDSKERNVPF